MATKIFGGESGKETPEDKVVRIWGVPKTEYGMGYLHLCCSCLEKELEA